MGVSFADKAVGAATINGLICSREGFRHCVGSLWVSYQYSYDRWLPNSGRVYQAGLAIFISCLGLFGLAAYVAEQRTKEIGVRKVLGASVVQVWVLLSRDFVLLVLIGALVAAPVVQVVAPGHAN